MNKLPESPSKDALAGDERWKLVLRIAETPAFRRSLRLRSFLLYVCERTLLGREEDVHEAQIGAQVFGKAADYNPGDDNVVRVTARLLRRRLNEYFEEEGKDETLRLVIPTGRYVPVFEPRSGEAAGDETAVIDGTEDESAPGEADRGPRRWRILAAILAVMCAVLAVQNIMLRRDLAPYARRMNPVLGAVFQKDRPTKIIVSDSSYSFAQDLIRGHGTLYQYIDAFPRSFLETPRPGDLNEIVRQTLRRQYTSLADLNIAARLIQVSGSYWGNTGVFFSRNVTARDLKGANLILIGSRRSNPWVEMFEGPLNFRYERDDESGRSQFRNRAPRAGESAIYLSDTGQYAQVALVPNIDHNGQVLILAGTNNTGTEAAGEMVTKDARVEALVRDLRMVERNGAVAPFELLIRLNSIAGTPRESEVAAHRP
jgi:hypothetical protein